MMLLSYITTYLRVIKQIVLDDDYYSNSCADIRDTFKHLTKDEKLQFLHDYYLNKTLKTVDEVLVYPITVKQSK